MAWVWCKRTFRRFKTRFKILFRTHLPGSSRGSRWRNFLSYLLIILALAFVFLLAFDPAPILELQIASIMACLLAFLYFWEVVITGIFLITDKFRISPIRFVRDIMISAFYTICAFAFHYQQFGLNGPDCETPNAYNNLYFSAVTFSTLGYGDFSPMPEARFFAAIEALYGNIHLGLLAGATFLVIEEFSKRKG